MDTTKEYHSYINKLGHVTASCRLTEEEESNVWVINKQGTPLIKNRSEFLCTQKEGRPAAALSHPRLKMAGQPYRFLENVATEQVNFDDTGFVHYRYERPNGMAHVEGEDVLEILITDSLAKDDLSGSTRQLGFLFLYELL